LTKWPFSAKVKKNPERIIIMKKVLFYTILLSCTAILPSCAWNEQEQAEPSEMTAKSSHENNIIYLHEYQTRFGSTQEAFKSIPNDSRIFDFGI